MLCEWRRGRPTEEELAGQELLFPARAAAPFGVREAAIAADLYGRVRNARRREIALAIAACAISRGASLWTLNRRDFEDIPDLDVV